MVSIVFYYQYRQKAKVKNKKVILIEDNEDDYEAFTRSIAISQENWEVLWLNSSEEAFSYFDKIKKIEDLPQLVFLDLNMPGKDGRKILKFVKSDNLLKIIPIVVFTSSIDQKDIDDCYLSGANSYVHKPLSYDNLKQSCKVILKYWQRAASL